MSENDADKRPRMYGQATTSEGSIEVTVEGSEGETTDDIEPKFERRVEELLDAQDRMPEDDPPSKGVE